jgi:hypothetical protein
MRLGLLADVHEEVEHLQQAIDLLRSQGVSKFVVLGDIFDTGQRIDDTVGILSQLDSVGVWGNHDLGLCQNISEYVYRRYSAEVLKYFGSLKPWLEVCPCRFQHIEPFLDSTSFDDLWSYDSDGMLDPARSFAATSARRIFMGHVHRWELLTPGGAIPWSDREQVQLQADERYLVVVHGVQQGCCAWYDLESDSLCRLNVA